MYKLLHRIFIFIYIYIYIYIMSRYPEIRELKYFLARNFSKK